MDGAGPPNPQHADSGERSLQQTTDVAPDAEASVEETEGAGPKGEDLEAALVDMRLWTFSVTNGKSHALIRTFSY